MDALGNYTQLAWVVHDLDDAIARWVALGAGPFFKTDVSLLPERDYRGTRGRERTVAAHGFLGRQQLELIQPTSDEPSLFREILDHKGESLHHIQPNCGVLDAAGFDLQVQRYRARGLEIAQTMDLSVMRVVFFDAVEQTGLFLELAERPPSIYQNAVDMYQAHLNWDGRNPVRHNDFVDLAIRR